MLMRKIIFNLGVITLFLGIALNGNSQTFFSEGFENGFSAGWTVTDATVWSIDDGTNNGPGAAHSGDSTAMFNNTDAQAGTTAEIITPLIDLSSTASGDSIILSYWYWDGGGSEQIQVLVSTDGTNYTAVDTTDATVDPWTEQFVNLSAYAGEDTLYISFKGTSVMSMGESSNPNVDDIVVKKIIANDLMAYDVYGPASHCGMTTDTIKISIVNTGTNAQNSYSATYSIDGGATWITPENISTTINPNDTLIYKFTTLADFSTPGTYNIMGAVILNGDGDSANDTITGDPVTSIPVISSYPYIQDFEGEQFWHADGTASSWQLGTPAGSTINSAASGSNVWETNLTGNYNANENSYVESPCFDFSTLHNPLVQFNYWVESDCNGSMNNDGARLDYSIDGGATWNSVGNMGDWVNWYNMSSISSLSSDGWGGNGANGTNGWVEAKHLLLGLAGQPSVKFRIVFASDGITQYDGFAFDDFTIREGDVDLAITEINYNGPEGGSDSTEFIEWYNYGEDAVNVNGYYYSQGVNDTLPDLMVLPGEFFVSAIDSSVMANFFSYSGAIQWDGGALSNGGETITLNTSWGTSIYSVSFDDGNGWPTQPDGHGPSLVFCDQNIGLDANNPANWNVSNSYVGVINGVDVYASPGALDSICLWDIAIADIQTGDTIADCDFSATDTVMIELTNVGGMSIAAGDTIFGWYQLNNNSVVADTMVLDADLNPGDTVLFIFSQTVDASALGYYDAGLWFNYFDDYVNVNDSAFFTLNHYQPVVDLGSDICTSRPDTVVLDAGAEFDSYLWQDGSTNQTYHVTDYGTYFVQVYDSNDCEATDTIVVSECTGIYENELSGVSIYPNPNNGQFVIDLQNADNAQIEVLTISGQVIYSKQTNDMHNVIDLSNFDKGIYFVHIRGNKLSGVKKVVIE